MLKKIISYIATFLVIAMLIVLLGLIICKSTILNEQYMLNSLSKDGYYEKINIHIQETFRNYILQSGLEEDILENLYETDKLKNDLNGLIHFMYTNEKFELDTSSIKYNLQDRINKIMADNKKTPTTDEKKAINSFITSITDTYESEVVYSVEIASVIGNVIKKVQPIVTIAIIVLSVMSTICIIIIILLNKNNNFVSIIFLGVGFAYIILNIAIKQYVGINNILFLNEVFSKYVIYLINSILNIFMISGGIFATMGIILSFCGKKK